MQLRLSLIFINRNAEMKKKKTLPYYIGACIKPWPQTKDGKKYVYPCQSFSSSGRNAPQQFIFVPRKLPPPAADSTAFVQ